jgi:hypothetical protein
MVRNPLRGRQHHRTLFSLLPSPAVQHDGNDESINEQHLARSKLGTTATAGSTLRMPARQGPAGGASSSDRRQSNHSNNHIINPSSTNNRPIHSHHQVEIQDLLDSPVGSLLPSTWLRAQHLLQDLCDPQQQQQQQQQKQQHQDIHLAFEILDRLAREPDSRTRMTNEMVYLVVQQWLNLYASQQKKHSLWLDGNNSNVNNSKRHRRAASQNPNHHHSDSSSVTESSTRNDNNHQQRHTRSMNLGRDPMRPSRPVLLLPSPVAVWAKVDGYQRGGVPLESSTYHAIIEGTAYHAPHAFAGGLPDGGPDDSDENGPMLGEAILERMMSESGRTNPLLRPSARTFHAVLVSWNAYAASRRHSRGAAQEDDVDDLQNDDDDAAAVVVSPSGRALALLEKLKMLYETNWGPEFLPDRNVYRRVMTIFAHRGDGDQVEALLEELYNSYLYHIDDHHQQQQQDQQITGIGGGGRRQNKRRFVQQYYQDLLLPTTALFSLVLFAWSKSDDPMAAERAEVILDRMLELEASGEVPNLNVTSSCFNIVMIGYTRRRTLQDALKVQSLFDRLKGLQQQQQQQPLRVEDGRRAADDGWSNNPKSPIGGTYYIMLTMWSRFDPAKSEMYFWEWKDEYGKGNCEMRLDAEQFRAVIAGWYNHASNSTMETAERIDRLMEFAVQTNIVTHQGGGGPAAARPPVELPTAASFSMAISAWCRTNTLKGVQRAEELLYQMQAHHDVHQRSDTSSTVLSYLPIVQSWATLGRMERAEELLMEYFGRHSSRSQALPPRRRWSGIKNDSKDSGRDRTDYLNTQIFNAVLRGWLSKVPVQQGAAIRAEDLLLSMRSHGSKPNAASFQLVLDAWRKSVNHTDAQHPRGRNGRPPKVDQILNLLDEEYQGWWGAKAETKYLTLRQGWALLSVM